MGKLIWLFPIALALHNSEEALWLPGWMQRRGGRFSAIDPRVFRWATTVLSLLACLLAWLSWKTGPQTFWTDLLVGAAIVALCNVFVPHVALSLLTKEWMPGTATGVVVCLPALGFLVFTAWREHLANPWHCLACAAGVGILLAAMLGALFRCTARMQG